MTNILEIKNLSFQYPKTTIFKNFSMKVPEGQFIGIAGGNASGKTTLIKLMAGMLPSNDAITIGYSYVNSKRVYDFSKELGIVFGNLSTCFLFEDVYKEMAFPLENLNIEPTKIEKRILEIANLFCITKLLDKKVADLTNTEKQQLRLAIAFLHEPKILLLDNPFSMMEKETVEKMKKSLHNYQKEHLATIILATPNLEDILEADYLYILHQGEIVIEGEPSLVLKEDTMLNRLGLEIPFMADLSNKLRFYNLLDQMEFDMEGMVNALWK